MDEWLREFPYRVDWGAGTFLASELLALGIAWVAVGLLAWRAAQANPVETLRYE